MSKKLYVSSMPYNTSSEDVNKLFSRVGKVVSAKVITNSSTGLGKGFGFVEMETEQDAVNAIEKLHGSDLGGRTISVSLAHSENRPEKNDKA
jgi:RNA recognition motif-containing protein